jgi:hypothetical protein
VRFRRRPAKANAGIPHVDHREPKYNRHDRSVLDNRQSCWAFAGEHPQNLGAANTRRYIVEVAVLKASLSSSIFLVATFKPIYGV